METPVNKPMVWIPTFLPTILALSFLACSDTNFPKADHEVRIEDGRFFPKDPDIQRGDSVRWVNFLPRSPNDDADVRTVTSGTPQDSTSAGALFDAVLKGHEVGEVEGDDFIWIFNDPGEFPYFSRFPEGAELTGTVVVR